MTDKHNYSFFGQSTALIVSSSSKEEPYLFLKCIKKKSDGNWEKMSQGEGKTIKCSLDEIIMMLQVLEKKIPNWSSFHSYKDIQTQISFSWENGAGNRLWVNIGNYSKMLTFAQTEVFRLLLEHLLNEKIEFGTNLKYKEKQNEARYTESQKEIQTEIKQPPLSKPAKNKDEAREIQGAIKGETEKALLINFEGDHEIWIPKSTIHSQYESERDKKQLFIVENWILKRNNIIA